MHSASGTGASNILDRRTLSKGMKVEYRENPGGDAWTPATIVEVEAFAPATGESHVVEDLPEYEEGDEVHLGIVTVEVDGESRYRWGYWSQVRIP